RECTIFLIVYMYTIFDSTINIVILRTLLLNKPSSTYFYILSLHDALPISHGLRPLTVVRTSRSRGCRRRRRSRRFRELPEASRRSEEHTSELQSRVDLVCRLLLDKKKKFTSIYNQNLYHRL